MNEQTVDPNVAAAAAGAGMGVLIFMMVLGLLALVSTWKIFTKAGQPGWAVLIPFYNLYVFLKIAGKPGWWMILMFIPVVHIVVWILANVAFAKNFGKGGGFVVGLILLPIIFYPILGFGSARYQPVAS